MADITRKITLTQKTARTGEYFLVEYSTDCVNYTQSIDCTNLYLPSVGSVGYCTVDLDTSCIRLTSLGAGCGNSVIEDLDPTPTTTTTTTTSTTTTSTTSTTTTTTAAPTTTTTTVAGQKLFVIESTNNTAFPFNSASHDIVLNRFLATSFTKDGYEPGFSAVSASRVITGTSELNTFIGWSGFPAGTLQITQSLFGDATLIATNAQVVDTTAVTGISFSPGNINYDSYSTIKSVNFINPTGSTTTTTTTTTAAPTTTTTSTTTTTTTTTTTEAPLLISNGSVTCIGNLGTFTSTFSGGSGTYSYTAIADSQANASNAVQGISGTRYAVTGNTYEWASIANGTYYVAVMDSLGTVSVQNTPVVINCTTTTTSTTTTTTAAPTTTTTTIPSACYTLETVQSSQGECFDCPGYFASTTDTVMKIFTACSGSEIFPPFDINVESRYSDNSTSSLFIPSGYTSSIIIATSDVQCVAAPTCGEIASPTFVSASIVPVSGTIVECCV